MEQTLTHHFIDDHTMTPSEALGIFRMHFPLIPARQITADESRMSFNFRHKTSAEDFLEDAERTIKLFNLPLEASLYKGPLYLTLLIESKPK